MIDHHGDRIEDVEPQELHLKQSIPLSPAGEDPEALLDNFLSAISGRPQTLNIWLERIFFKRSPINRSGVACTYVAWHAHGGLAIVDKVPRARLNGKADHKKVRINLSHAPLVLPHKQVFR